MSDYNEKAIKINLKPTNEVNTTEEDLEVDIIQKPNQVKIEDLLSYCNDIGMDDECLKFTHPDYYLENVEIQA